MNKAAMRLTQLALALSTSISSNAANAQTPVPNAQNKLNTIIRDESSAIKGLELDLGPSEKQNLQSEAEKYGGNALAKQVASNESASAFTGCNLAGEIAILSKQLKHIPVISQILSTLNNAVNSQNGQQFSKPKIASRMLRPDSGGGTQLGISSIIGDLNSAGDIAGLSSMTKGAACQGEMKQAATVLPAAIKNLEQENQEYKQLMSE